MFRRNKKQDEYQDEYYDEAGSYIDGSAQDSGEQYAAPYDDGADYDDDQSLASYNDQSQIEIPRGSMLMSDDELMGNLPEEEYENDEIRDYHPIRFRRDGKTGLWGGIMYAVFVISVSIILACMAWMFASDVLALNKQYAEATVTIPKYVATAEDIAAAEKEKAEAEEGETVYGVPKVDIDEVAQILKDSGMIEYKFLFKLYAKVSHAAWKIDGGTYTLNTNYDYRALVKKMQIGSGSQVVTRVTFPEGFSVMQIFNRLEENNICSVEDLKEAAANYNYSYSFLEDLPMGDASRLEGYLFPDTYDFYEGMQASSAINKLLRQFHYTLTAEMYDLAEDMGLTLHQVIIVASMIEKEAANDDERAKIASVIYNRLNAGMPLGIDATILYEFPEWSGSSIPDEIINYDSPYNTRTHTGLPPTPICNPGKASITAAVKPEHTNYYYYALDTATGTHRFFTNATDFNNFVATQSY